MKHKKPLKILIATLIVCLVCIAGFFTAFTIRNNQEFIVTFNSNGGVGGIIQPQTVKYGKTAQQPASPTKTKYRFTGWYKDPLCTVLYKFESSVKADMILYAGYIKTYIVEFETFCDCQIDPLWVDENSFVNRPDDPQREGFNFINWYLDEDLSEAYDFNTPLTSDIKLYADWERIYYLLKFDSCGGSQIESQMVYVDEKPVMPQNPYKKDYVFHAWYMDADYKYRFDFDAPLKYDITVYAYWDLLPDDSVKVTFYLDPLADYFAKYPKIYDFFQIEKGEKIDAPVPYDIGGYRFDGWYADPELTQLFDFDLQIDADAHIYGKLTQQLKVYFWDGSDYLLKTVYAGEFVNRPDDPVKDGYAFCGWFLASSSAPMDFSQPIYFDLVLIAKFLPQTPEEPPPEEPTILIRFVLGIGRNDIVISFELNDTAYTLGTILKSNPDLPNISNDLQTNLYFDNYVFTGWYTDESCTFEVDLTFAISDDAVFYADWRQRQIYSVTFLDWDGTLIFTNNVREGDSISPPAAPLSTRKNYIFCGWMFEDEFTAVQRNIESYAIYEYDSTDANCFSYITYLDGYLITTINTSDAVLAVNTSNPPVVYHEKSLNITTSFIGMTEIRIKLPIAYQGKPVYGIAATEDGIAKNLAIEYIFIPHSYNQIGANAFKNCISLTEIEFENFSTIEIIGDYAFYGTGITEIFLPESINELKIGEYAFANCSSLIVISFCQSLQSIGRYAFYRAGCGTTFEKDKKVTLEFAPYCRIQEIEEFAFAFAYIYDCNLTLLHCKIIRAYAFYYSALSEINLANIVEIGDMAFYPRLAPLEPILADIAMQAGIIRLRKSVVLGDSIKSIGCYNFLYDADITLSGANLEYIGNGAFIFSTIKSITLTGALKYLGGNVFAYATIKDLNYLANVDIPSGTFYCAAISKYEFDGDFKKIDEYAFYYVKASGTLVLPISVTTIGLSCFYGSEFSEIQMPDAVNLIGIRAFANMPNLISIIIPKGVNRISDEIFYYSAALTTVSFRGEIISIGTGAFFCTALAIIDWPQGLTSIGDQAFFGTKITYLRLGGWIKQVDMRAFENCFYIETIEIASDSQYIRFTNQQYFTPDSLSFKGFFVEDGNAYFSSISGDVNLYSADKQCLEFFVNSDVYVCPESLTEIAPYQFANRYDLRMVFIGENIRSIGEYAFAGSQAVAMNLVYVDFLSAISLTSIGRGAFMYNRNLLYLNLEKCIALDEIFAECFFACDSLSQISLPSDGVLKRIGEKSFALESEVTADGGVSSKLKSFDFGDILSLSIIEIDAFAYRTALESVVLPKSLKSLSGFLGCERLKSVKFKNDCMLTEVGDYAFYGCLLLQDFVFGDGVTYIGRLAFAFSGIKEVNLKSLTQLGYGAFYDAKNLITVDLAGCKITEIPERAFFNAASLTTLNLPQSLIQIGELAFSSTGLFKVNVPKSVCCILAGAFADCLSLNEIYIGDESGSDMLFFGTIPFEGCVNLTKIYIFATQPPSVISPKNGIANSGRATGFQKLQNLKIFVPKGSLNSYETAKNKPIYDNNEELSWAFHIGQMYSI